MPFSKEMLAGSSGQSTGFYDYNIEQSLRFDGTAPFLGRTFATGNRRTYTFSVWIKRSPSGQTNEYIFHTSNAGASSASFLYFTNNILAWYDSSTSVLSTNRRFRDFSNWYHIVLAVDTTDGTAGNRTKLYVNGVQETSYSAENNFSENHQTYLNSNIDHFLGSSGTNLQFNGYMAEVHFVDGTVLTPSSFGETKDGIWVAKEYTGSHGTTGFYLPMGATATSGFSADFDGSGDNVRFTNATQYDIASDDDFCLEFYTKGDFEANYSYGIGDYDNGYFLLQMGANGVIYGYYGNGAANTMGDMTAYLTTTSWHHIAYVRESETYRLYIDGVQRGTGTGGGTTAHDVAGFNLGDAHPAAGAPHFNGKVSNLRFTIGAARYTGGTTFIVPTSTLTNDSSNVKLLAFTTATITADGSTAAISGSITEGDPVFSTDSPFSALIGDDASSNTNDFTHSNIDFEDVILDSPTNNFCTANPLHKRLDGTVTISEGNLQISAGASYGGDNRFAGTTGVSSGKWYFEMLRTDATGLGNQTATGVFDADTALSSGAYSGNGTNSGAASNEWALTDRGYACNTSTYTNLSGTIGTVAQNKVVQVAVDMDNKKIWFGIDNTFSGDPAAGSGEAFSNLPTTILPMLYTAQSTQVFNFGQDSSFSGAKTSGSANASDDNNQGDFFYAPPSGYLALCSANLPDPTLGPGQSEQATDNYTSLIWTGNGSDGRSITGVGFDPDWVWIKSRNLATSHLLNDTLRGANASLFAEANTTETANNGGGYLSAFVTDGFSVTSGGSGDDAVNDGSDTYVSWNWKAGGAPTASNSEAAGAAPTSGSVMIDGVASTSALAGSIAATKISANTKAGFSIGTFTKGSGVETVAHGLTAAPNWYVVKRTNGSGSWFVYHSEIASDAETDYIRFNSSAAKSDDATVWGDTAPTSTVFSVGAAFNSSEELLFYAGHNVEGFSKFGTFEGNSSADGTFVFCGFKPARIWLKRSDSSSVDWTSYDLLREGFNVENDSLRFVAAVEQADDDLDILSNGFKMRRNMANNQGTIAFFAWADSPFKFANAR